MHLNFFLLLYIVLQCWHMKMMVKNSELFVTTQCFTLLLLGGTVVSFGERWGGCHVTATWLYLRSGLKVVPNGRVGILRDFTRSCIHRWASLFLNNWAENPLAYSSTFGDDILFSILEKTLKPMIFYFMVPNG